MKIIINKSYRVMRYLMLLAVATFWLSCEEDQVTYSEGSAINQAILDPYIQVVTGFIPFKPGTEKYGITFNVLNGVKAITSVKVYGFFKDATTGFSSNEVLYGTYTVGELRTVVKDSLTYDELRAGLTVGGSALPAVDVDVAPGSGWTFRFEGVTASGGSVTLLGAINMVLSKYAGIYKVIASKYVRGPGEDFGGWNDTEVFIGHVDDITLSYNDKWGYFAWGGCSFNFTVDPDTKEIEAPFTTACGLFSGVAPLSCKENGSDFANLDAVLGYKACEVSNIIIDDEVNGEHIIKLTYGYMGANGVPRAFTETLKKVVD